MYFSTPVEDADSRAVAGTEGFHRRTINCSHTGQPRGSYQPLWCDDGRYDDDGGDNSQQTPGYGCACCNHVTRGLGRGRLARYLLVISVDVAVISVQLSRTHWGFPDRVVAIYVRHFAQVKCSFQQETLMSVFLGTST